MSIVLTRTQNESKTAPPTADWTDEQLLLQYRVTGEEALFSELVHRYERELYAYLCRYLRDRELAEDAFQAAFLQLHLKCDQFEEGRRVRPWLYMIATNKAIDLQRHGKRHRALSLDAQRGSDGDGEAYADLIEGSEPEPSSELGKAERGQWVSDTVADLPEHLRVVVHLVYLQGLMYREAAEALSVPVGTIKSRMHAALKSLASSWESRFNENDR